MTSLIDVIFLLLLFFMLSSTFTRFAEIQLIGTSAGRAGEPAQAPPIFLRLGEEQLGLNGRVVDLENLMAQIDRLEPQDAQKVLVAPGPAVTAQRLVDLLTLFSTRPELSVVVLE